MSHPYWGELPPPNITRGNSFKVQEDGQKVRGNRDLSIVTDMAGGRSAGPGHHAAPSRQDRYSTQTDKTDATFSTQSPFVSPIASEFRGGGLAPRPPSFPLATSQAAYNQDFAEKRRRRESRNREDYDAPSPVPPPSAPDPPRAPPPVSYKNPYSNGAPTYQAPGRSRSTRKSDGPVSPGTEDYHRTHARAEYHPGDEAHFQARRLEPSNGKAPGRHPVAPRGGVERTESNTSHRRKDSLSEAEAQRRREWAPDRSPLQRLELTLDSITKEEKRARVEEAELLMREAKAGRGGERAVQNSVRFRNRPVAKAPEPGSQPGPQSPSGAGVLRKPSTKPKEQLQERSPIQKTLAVPATARNQGSADQNRKPSTNDQNLTPQRAPSTRDQSYVAAGVASGAIATSVVRRGSNKLRKEPPGDHWSRKPVNAGDQYPDINVQRRPSTTNRQNNPTDPGPTRGAAFQSHSQAVVDKVLPSLPPNIRANELEINTTPIRRETLNKAERVTGQNIPASPPGSGPTVETKRAMVVDTQYAVQPSYVNPSMSRNIPQGSHSEHHHLSDVLNHFHHSPAKNDGVYVPSARLDEWKKGGVALLSGPLLDLDIDMKTNQDEQSEIEKDKAWWEAGNKSRRRRSSAATTRKAEAYDGEYDDSTSMHPPSPNSCIYCEGCASESMCCEIAAFMHSHHNTEHQKKEKNKHQSSIQKTRNPSHHVPILRPHTLTSSVRPGRIRPLIAPTRFKPPLFLKSGPLLRYCGIRREKVKSRSGRSANLPDREIWRGSVMVVTQDDHSSYELAPTLRIFLQPVDLLPPPPAHVNGEELAPEYIDPLAGLPKIGRDGRTLYIRPIDHLEEGKDLSREESDDGLYESQRSPPDGAGDRKPTCSKPHYDGEKAGKYKEVRGFRLHAEQGVTFWRFNLEIELREKQQRIAYRINRGPATPFWVPARGEAMNIMFHSCNGFSHGVDSNQFCGPDPMWRDVLSTHQTQPFHVMLGGGDQIYNDSVMDEVKLFREWSDIKDPFRKERTPWTAELQLELETFYLNRYCTWFSQGLFGLAASQIPMINIFDDHDIIDGFGSYSTRYMESPVFSGLGSVAFKYYMLFQHQSSIDEGEDTESSWLLGTQPGPFIKELSRSVFTNLGRSISFLGLDCRTERMNDEIVSAETYHKVFDRLSNDIVKGETKHLIVLVGVPVAYPRMVWLENILTSRAMEPIKALGRAGLLGKKLLNHMDGGVEILDDLDDHWTARHHKDERNWFIQELQDLAAEKSIRVTILGGDVHLAAVGQFYSNPKLGIPKDHDFRYMPNVISSAIVNTPPPDTLADLLNKRNKVHHLDAETDEDMIPIFTHDVTGKPRNNKRLLNRRNWCSIRTYNPDLSPPPTPQTDGPPTPPPKRGLFRRLSTSRGPNFRPDAAPPPSNAAFFTRRKSTDGPPLSSPGFFARRGSTDSQRPNILTRTLSLTRSGSLFRRGSKRRSDNGGINGYDDSDPEDYDEQQYDHNGAGIRGGSGGSDEDDGGSYFPPMSTARGPSGEHPINQVPQSVGRATPHTEFEKSKFQRTPTGLSEKQLRNGAGYEVNLEGGLDICLNVEVNPKDPAGITMPYRLLVPALWYDESQDRLIESIKPPTGVKRWNTLKKNKGKEKEMEMEMEG